MSTYTKGQQHQAKDVTTVIASAAVAANRFIAYDGAHATAAGGAHDCQGISQTAPDLVLLGALPTVALAVAAGILLDAAVEASR